jgi:hypothetical protein
MFESRPEIYAFIHQLLVYTDNIIMGENINTLKTEVLLQAGREVDLEEDTEKTNYTFMSFHQNAGHHYLLIANKVFGNVANFKYCEQEKLKAG